MSDSKLEFATEAAANNFSQVKLGGKGKQARHHRHLPQENTGEVDKLSQVKLGGKGKLVRVQLDLPQEKIDELNSLMKKAGLDTRKDLFNNALSLFAWAVKEKEKGNVILAMNEDTNTSRELVMHPLETAAEASNVTRRNKSKALHKYSENAE